MSGSRNGVHPHAHHPRIHTFVINIFYCRYFSVLKSAQCLAQDQCLRCEVAAVTRRGSCSQQVVRFSKSKTNVSTHVGRIVVSENYQHSLRTGILQTTTKRG